VEAGQVFGVPGERLGDLDHQFAGRRQHQCLRCGQVQVQLLQDYYSNLLAYPRWQQFLHEKQPPTLIVWGKNDPSFIADGAKAYLKDVPRAELHLLDAGHFAVEEKPGEIAQYILGFMRRLHGARMPA